MRDKTEPEAPSFLQIGQGCLKVASLIESSNGAINGVSAIDVDTTERKKAAEPRCALQRFAFSVLDALTAHIAVLDERGVIVAVNKAWRDFATANSALMMNVCEGADYLAACDIDPEVEDRPLALAFVRGIRNVMAGTMDEFSLDYPCHSPSEKRWFLGRVTRFSGSGSLRIVVAHENITERKRAEEALHFQREHLEEMVRERTVRLDEKNEQLTREVAERKQAEKAIRESEERLRIFVELVPGIICRIREDRTIDFISSAIRQLGYEPRELIGKPFDELVHPEDIAQIRSQLLERRVGERRTKRLELRFIHGGARPDGGTVRYSVMDVSVRGYWNVPDSEINSRDKRFLYTLCIAHDITSRKQAEEALQESERRVGLLKDVAAAANSAGTVDDVFRVAVEGIARYIGWPVGHVYVVDEKKPGVLVPTDIWHLEDVERFRMFREVTSGTVFTAGKGMIGRVLESKKTLWIENVSAYSDFQRRKLSENLNVAGAFGFPVMVSGKVTAVLEFFSPKAEKANPFLMAIMDEIGQHLGIVIERKNAERELKKLWRAVEQSPASVVITDVKGRIQYANPKFAELTGYALAEIIGRNPRIMNAGVQPTGFYRELWETILAGREWYGQFCNRKKDGEIYWERASISPVRDESGEIRNFVAVKEDITQLLQYEDELKQAKEVAENANRAKSDFLAGMSHELRTPLNAIIGFSEVLEEKYFGPLTEKQGEYVADILDSGRHLLSLINDILDLSKVEAGKMELELARVNVSELIRSSLTMVRERASTHTIALHLDMDRTVGEKEIMADQRKLKQVLFNLLSNAVKFTPDGGAVRLTARLRVTSPTEPRPDTETGPVWAALHGEDADCFLEVSVDDNGIGLSPEHLDRIFDPFFQVGSTMQGKTPGTGLGLSLSKDLIELQGGTIRAESGGHGKGSRFSFRIPVKRCENETD